MGEGEKGAMSYKSVNETDDFLRKRPDQIGKLLSFSISLF